MQHHTLSKVSGIALTAAVLAGAANAQYDVTTAPNVVTVSSNITVDTTWTANQVYSLTQQVFVDNGATLTIEPGTLVIQDVITNGGGSLAVARGSKIEAEGTWDAPIIFTSDEDVSTWPAGGNNPTGRNPLGGTWRFSANEWGNLTVMGRGYIGSCFAGNDPDMRATNQDDMEGLLQSQGSVFYGGGDDDDDSGTLSYISIRYAGLVVGLTNELNGLSLGGIGRGTDISYIEIMNNVDDGIEIWGGTMNINHFSIWNVGDDSLDCDQGWRGTAQFGLIVQGASILQDDGNGGLEAARQGSGTGDNMMEIDGAELANYEPITTCRVFNVTAIGNPIAGDGLTAWRDNARIQYRGIVGINGAEDVVRFDNVDGDPCGTGYQDTTNTVIGSAYFSTLFTTPYTSVPVYQASNPAEAGATGNDHASIYTTQVDGTLCDFSNSLFFGFNSSSAFNESGSPTAAGSATDIFNVAGNPLRPVQGNNEVVDSIANPGLLPIQGLTFDPNGVTPGANADVLLWKFVDPRPANGALTSLQIEQPSKTVHAVNYRGGFAPGNNWLCNWTASSAYGFTPATEYCDIGFGKGSQANGELVLIGNGQFNIGSPLSASVTNGQPNAFGGLAVALEVPNVVSGRADQNVLGGTLVPNALNTFGTGLIIFTTLDGNGERTLPLGSINNAALTGFKGYAQAAFADGTLPQGFAFSNALAGSL